MKILVDLRLLDINIEKHIQDNLASKGAPSCLGCMFPPLISYSANVEITDIFKDPDSVEAENIMSINPQAVVSDKDAAKVVDTVISKDSYQLIVNDAMKVAEHYADSVIKCTSCKYVDICYKLTSNYLKLIEISSNN